VSRPPTPPTNRPTLAPTAVYAGTSAGPSAFPTKKPAIAPSTVPNNAMLTAGARRRSTTAPHRQMTAHATKVATRMD